MKLYKPSNKLYLILMTISLIIIGSSLYDSMDSRAFIIKTGLGCGCFASVAVAWMVDYSSCKALKNDLNLKTEYDALAPAYDIIQTMIDAWKNFNITQKELPGKQIRYNE